MQLAKKYVSAQQPTCKIGSLDSVYFYIYGCVVPNTFVVDMSIFVGPGFLFTSDKSLTMITNMTTASILLANAWNMILKYSTSAACGEEFEVVSGSRGCVVDNKCSNNQIIVGCGSLSCAGCTLVDFFTTYSFETATFQS